MHILSFVLNSRCFICRTVLETLFFSFFPVSCILPINVHSFCSESVPMFMKILSMKHLFLCRFYQCNAYERFFCFFIFLLLRIEFYSCLDCYLYSFPLTNYLVKLKHAITTSVCAFDANSTTECMLCLTALNTILLLCVLAQIQHFKQFTIQ